MKPHPGQTERRVTTAKSGVCAIVVLCAALLAVLLCCRGCLSPPDLSSCTTIEIQYDPSTLDYFLPGTDAQNVLSPAEKKYLQSLKTFVVNDPERIKAFSHDVSLGSYNGRLEGSLAAARCAYVDCYRSSKRRLVSFTVFGDLIVTDDGVLGPLFGSPMFKYPTGLPNLDIIEPPEVRPFKLRGHCAWNLQGLYTAGPLNPDDVSAYPEPDEWCDAIVRVWRSKYSVDEKGTRRRRYSEEEISKTFMCPSVRERVYAEHSHGEPTEPNSAEQQAPLLQSHYAMNPSCKPNSPPDTVLFFETKAGWNQHGGPELFTFDNHEPHGGCVLLNDGTVKFIRTEEELAQLRWK